MNNPSAFPVVTPDGGNGCICEGGMTLRDYFAAQIIGHLASMETRSSALVTEDVETSYFYADAMLKARES